MGAITSLMRAISAALLVSKRARDAAKKAKDETEKANEWSLAFSELEQAKRNKRRLLELKKNKIHRNLLLLLKPCIFAFEFHTSGSLGPGTGKRIVPGRFPGTFFHLVF